jgi:regulator of sigma E protease
MILQVLRFLFILLEVIVLFNLLIIVHELGHFLAARWRGLYIEAFGVWFGKPIWKKTLNGVQYSLGSIPFGGFVKLPQLAPMDIIEGTVDVDRERLPNISALDKIIVAVAGAALQPAARAFLRLHRLGRWPSRERVRQDDDDRLRAG